MTPADWLSHLLPAQHGAAEQRLAGILGLPAAELASVRLGPRYHYRPFTIAKSDGRERRLLAPSPALKKLQRRLLDHHLAALPVHPCATAFRKGTSIVDNARRHARQALIATVDLRDFFEATQAHRVRACFVRHGWRDEALRTLMRLCVLRNGLPQGAPTSPCLSNLVNVPLDERLHQLALRSRALYTRYGDDLTFSWDHKELPGGFQQAVEECLHAAGYEIQPCKAWRVQSIHEQPCVTGLVLRGNGRIGIPWAWRWRMWQARWHLWWQGGDAAQARWQGYEGLRRMMK